MFLTIIFVLIGAMLLYGLGTLALAIWGDPSETVVLRIIGGFGAMFSGILGLVAGYLIGYRENNGN